MSSGARFERAVEIMARLRAPGGCPWDREQTFDSIKPYTLEETYEVFEAIEKRDWPALQDELGDLLLQVLFYAEMAREAGYFSIDDVVESLSEKLVRRHPHVFGDVEARHADEVLKNWDTIKRAERGLDPGARHHLLDSVSRKMPALQEAEKMNRRAAKTGFDWPSANGILEKIREEADELAAELPHGDRSRLEDEVGDLFFTVVNLARYLKVDSESALRASNLKFRRRFAAVEQAAWAQNREVGDLTLSEMEQIWEQVKELE